MATDIFKFQGAVVCAHCIATIYSGERIVFIIDGEVDFDARPQDVVQKIRDGHNVRESGGIEQGFFRATTIIGGTALCGWHSSVAIRTNEQRPNQWGRR